MSVTDQDEYQTANGETVSIQNNSGTWEVACWGANDECRWYKEYRTETEARAEFERWRP